MKISTNQVYFFPYIGYFQLINASDVFINLDHVQYTKRSYITSNTLKNGIEINIPVLGGSQTKSIRETTADCSDKWFDKFEKTLYFNYGKEKQFVNVYEEILEPWWKNTQTFLHLYNQISISEFNMDSIELVCKYLDIKTQLVYTSKDITEQKKEKGIQDIVKRFKGTEYINAIGGQSLYSKDNFSEQGIDLKFIKNKSELPTTSILDLLFKYNKDIIKQELDNYELV